jgi:colanic acid/amylovoran biosynthesis protein
MTKIFIIGLTGGGAKGTYETQLGNVAILIPMIKMLKKYIPNAEISTTTQLTDVFCTTYGINSIANPKKLLPLFDSVRILLLCFFDLFRASLWRVFRNFLHLNFQILIRGNKLERFSNSDVILDFNGDIFPSDTGIIRVLINTSEVLTIRQLKVPVIEFVSSPGPFNTWFRRFISKRVFNKINVIVNREPVSSELLKQIKIKKTPIVNAACPAFLLEPAPVEKAEAILMKENVKVNDRPLIGVTLAGYNLISQRTWGTPKNFDDLSLFVPMLKYLLDDLNASVFLLPHVYRVNPYTYVGEHINGPDHDILLHLYRMVDGDKYNGRLRLIEGKYTSSEAKAVIGQCDMYISGRLHAGVAALSQGIPTILLAYGHKHRGFARLVHQEKYVFEGTDPGELKAIVEDAWKNREKIKKVLQERLVRVKELAELNFKIVKEVVNFNEEERNNIPKEKSDIWVKMGE